MYLFEGRSDIQTLMEEQFSRYHLCYDVVCLDYGISRNNMADMLVRGDMRHTRDLLRYMYALYDLIDDKDTAFYEIHLLIDAFITGFCPEERLR